MNELVTQVAEPIVVIMFLISSGISMFSASCAFAYFVFKLVRGKR